MAVDILRRPLAGPRAGERGPTGSDCWCVCSSSVAIRVPVPWLSPFNAQLDVSAVRLPKSVLIGSNMAVVALGVLGFFVACLPSAQAQPLADSTLGLTEIVWQPEKTNVYIGSPSVVKLSNGEWLASSDRCCCLCACPILVKYLITAASSMDPNPSVGNLATVRPTTLSRLSLTGMAARLSKAPYSVSFSSVYLYRSIDSGKNWKPLSIVNRSYWSNLFTLGDDVVDALRVRGKCHSRRLPVFDGDCGRGQLSKTV